MTFTALLLFFIIMLVLAVLPSSSVVLVIMRAASLGLVNGIAVALGIVVADCLFLLIAIGGMAALANSLGTFVVVLKLLAGSYLIWLGAKLWSSPKSLNLSHKDFRHRTLLGSFLAGLMLTLADVKAILFYASLLPMLVDIQQIRMLDVVILLLLTMVTVGGVKIGYAIFARKIIDFLQQQLLSRGHRIAASMLMGVGVYIMVTS